MFTRRSVSRRQLEVIATLNVPAELTANLGPPSDAHDDLIGWPLEAECGLEFMLYRSTCGPSDFAVVVTETPDELEHLLLHLPHEHVELAAQRRHGFGWAVKRTDFSNNTFTVGEYPLEASARCVCDEFTRRGHHQDYSVVALRPMPGQPKPWLVKRIDDAGNEFLVEAHRWKPAAEAHARELNQTPRHKQAYWVEAARDVR